MIEFTPFVLSDEKIMTSGEFEETKLVFSEQEIVKSYGINNEIRIEN